MSFQATSGASPASSRPRVFYVSYDGVGEPLGRSQVLGYLLLLCKHFDITLISFEKPGADVDSLRTELGRHGIHWVPLRYHRRPPVVSTLLDVLAGRRALRREARRGRPQVVHVRSDVPALIALLSRRFTGGRLLFDIRGFWADERVDGGLWRAGGVLYRIAKRCERRFFREADAIVTLTRASVAQVRSWTEEREVPISVIPTCVDPERFASSAPRKTGPHVIWCGSLGTWYRFDLVAPLARRLRLPLEVITRQTEAARHELDGTDLGSSELSIRSVAPAEIPEQLAAGDIGLCLVSSSFSKQASAPTRFAEYLAAGMPVIVTPGVGDLESLVAEHRVGVVLRTGERDGVERAATEILALAAEHSTRERCREVARRHFDVKAGARCYEQLYLWLLRDGSGNSASGSDG